MDSDTVAYATRLFRERGKLVSDNKVGSWLCFQSDKLYDVVKSILKELPKDVVVREKIVVRYKPMPAEKVSISPTLDSEVATGLVNLGYDSKSAKQAATGLLGHTVEERMRESLQRLGG